MLFDPYLIDPTKFQWFILFPIDSQEYFKFIFSIQRRPESFIFYIDDQNHDARLNHHTRCKGYFLKSGISFP